MDRPTPTSHSPHHIVAPGHTDIFIVPLTNKETGETRWHVELRDSNGTSVWSQQGYASRQEASEALERHFKELGIQPSRVQ